MPNTLEMLEQLVKGWYPVTLSWGGYFVLEIVSKETGRRFTYRRAKLEDAIAAAWAGEPS